MHESRNHRECAGPETGDNVAARTARSAEFLCFSIMPALSAFNFAMWSSNSRNFFTHSSEVALLAAQRIAVVPFCLITGLVDTGTLFSDPGDDRREILGGAPGLERAPVPESDRPDRI